MKPTDISPSVKQQVWDRDQHCCVVCGSPQAMPNAHVFVSRAHGGLGIKENIATLCIKCHNLYDNGKDKEHYQIKQVLYNYMFKLYPNLDIDTLKYTKHRNRVKIKDGLYGTVIGDLVKDDNGYIWQK